MIKRRIHKQFCLSLCPSGCVFDISNALPNAQTLRKLELIWTPIFSICIHVIKGKSPVTVLFSGFHFALIILIPSFVNQIILFYSNGRQCFNRMHQMQANAAAGKLCNKYTALFALLRKVRFWSFYGLAATSSWEKKTNSKCILSEETCHSAGYSVNAGSVAQDAGRRQRLGSHDSDDLRLHTDHNLDCSRLAPLSSCSNLVLSLRLRVYPTLLLDPPVQFETLELRICLVAQE